MCEIRTNVPKPGKRRRSLCEEEIPAFRPNEYKKGDGEPGICRAFSRVPRALRRLSAGMESAIPVGLGVAIEIIGESSLVCFCNGRATRHSDKKLEFLGNAYSFY